MRKQAEPTQSFTRAESQRLGRAEYFNLDNAGLTVHQILRAKYLKHGHSSVWLRDFVNGFYSATMLSDDEFEETLKSL
jgi:hypothetical protein